VDFLPGLASSSDPPDLHLPSRKDYRHEPLCLAQYPHCTDEEAGTERRGSSLGSQSQEVDESPGANPSGMGARVQGCSLSLAHTALQLFLPQGIDLGSLVSELASPTPERFYSEPRHLFR
jgi:hypothetical protein